jgi:hypothetical protein
MPCYDHRDSPEEVREEAYRDFRHNSDVAEMLCSICKQAPVQEKWIFNVPGVEQWWKEHQIRDAKKRQYEQEEKRNKILRAQQALEKAQQTLQKLTRKK